MEVNIHQLDIVPEESEIIKLGFVRKNTKKNTWKTLMSNDEENMENLKSQ